MISSRKLFVSAGLAYTAFVVYGSLVPFDFKPLPLDFALRNFSQIRYLRLGPDARADWVANLLLYIPLSFLLLGALARQGRWFYSASCAVPVFLFCAALSITIEFLQQFFPPRTVSLNDLLAEFAGARPLGLCFGARPERSCAGSPNYCLARAGQPHMRH